MKSKPFFILLLFLLNACAFNEQTVENQISAGSNRTTAANQNTNAPTVSNAAVKEEPVKREVDYFAHLKAEHREVLREWLKSKPFLRPGVEEIDSIYFENGRITSEADLKFLRETVGNNGYQYYAVGDMNRDGKKDFAVMLVDTRKPETKRDADYFALAIFNAPFKTGQKPNYFEENLRGVTNSYIVFNKMTPKHLFLGKFESDFYCATYYPKGRTYYFKDCI